MRYKIEFVKKKLNEVIKIASLRHRRIGKKQCQSQFLRSGVIPAKAGIQ
jgi:hypothetical protein